LAAIEAIFDRLEGRPAQRLDLADLTADSRNRSTQELQFYLDHKRWPNDEELTAFGAAQDAFE
jgi:hypothetical protein